MFVGSGQNAAFGIESRCAVEVIQGDCAPLAEVVHAAGNAGALTESKPS